MKFEEWLSQQDGVIEVDCGCVTTEAFYHWMRVAYEAGTLIGEGTKQAGNSPVIPGAEQRIADAVELLKQAAPAMLADNGGPDGPLVGRVKSPVIPEGYVMVPKEPTPEILAVITEAIKSMRGSAATYARVLAAAPQPQNAPQNIPEIIPGWIPVSERMPPSRHEVLVGCWWGEKPRWCCKWATYIPGHPDAQSSGWLIPGGSWTPAHWMELPAGPKEVKGE